MRERVTVGQLAAVLREPHPFLRARCLKVLGQERCVEILIDALSMESDGGMLLKDGSRKRTLGRVFLTLCRNRAMPEERRRVSR